MVQHLQLLVLLLQERWRWWRWYRYCWNQEELVELVVVVSGKLETAVLLEQ
jgi:hypothetical protein